jgi:MoaA/NifB/PqqE/SkfB family radical SAM enzyme
MNERFVELPFLRNVGLMMTLRCQVTCPHCIVQASPYRKEVMREEDARDWIRQIADYRDGHVKVVALTGGEPFYNVESLRAISDFAAASGRLVSVVTNAFWASTPEKALCVLKTLPSIKMISVSTDIYHKLAIPLEWVKNAVDAARACGISYSVSVCTENEQEAGYLDILRQVQEFAPKELIMTAIALPVGRAQNMLGRDHYDSTSEVPVSACATGSSPVIFPDGRVIGCIGPVIDLPPGHPIYWGNVRETPLREIFDRAQTNTILHALRAWGPRKLIPMIQDAGLGDHLPTWYIRDSVCDACYKLMADERIVEFLDHLAEDPGFKRTVAFARAYYLREPEMVVDMGLTRDL